MTTEISIRLMCATAVLLIWGGICASFILEEVVKTREVMMTKFEELTSSVQGLIEAFKLATDEVARDLQALRDQLSTGLSGGLSASQAADLQSLIDRGLGAAKDRLVDLGKDPENPIPNGVVVPEPAPAVTPEDPVQP